MDDQLCPNGECQTTFFCSCYTVSRYWTSTLMSTQRKRCRRGAAGRLAQISFDVHRAVEDAQDLESLFRSHEVRDAVVTV